MYIYLSKKIQIPNNAELTCLSWNSVEGWIACGGENGVLKVLKLEAGGVGDSRAKGVAAATNLTMNQTLEGHKVKIVSADWNERHKKLTSSDSNGLIIVWAMHKNVWYEEMINNRNRSAVKDHKWSFDGALIAIVYEDGMLYCPLIEQHNELTSNSHYSQWINS